MSTIKAANIQNPSAASAAIVLDTSGNFSVPAGTVSAPGIQAPSDSNTGIFFPAADTIAFAEGGSEAMRIDSSSRLLVGASTTSNSSPLQVKANSDAFRVFNDSATNCYMTVDAGPVAVIGPGVVNVGDTYGFIGTSSNHFFQFRTNNTERMRIQSTGTVLIGKTSSDYNSAGIELAPADWITVTNDGLCLRLNRTGADGEVAQFMNDGTIVGRIEVSGSSTSYNTSSDYRLKENVVLLTGAIDRVNQLQVHRFNFIAEPDKTVDGFIAHEAQAVVPEAISGEKDAVDDDGNPVYQGIDQSKLVPLLTAALQEAIGEIESLKARLTAAGI